VNMLLYRTGSAKESLSCRLERRWSDQGELASQSKDPDEVSFAVQLQGIFTTQIGLYGAGCVAFTALAVWFCRMVNVTSG
jgi:hypothetical protein